MTPLRTRFAAALATFAGLVAGGFEAHVVPAATGAFWHGLTGGPSPAGLAFAGVAGLSVFALGGRADVRPLLLMSVGLGPLVPAITGQAVFLLAFSGWTMGLIFAMAMAMTAAVAAQPLLAAPLPLTPFRAFLVSFVFFVLVGFEIPGAAGPQGDEPHYLLIAESLLRDGDVDLRNQFDEKAYLKFTPARLEPHTAPRSPAGTLYAIHTPGLSAVVAPGYALAGYAGARAVVSAVLALSVALLFSAARRVLSHEAATFAFLALTFGTPLPVYANALFPDPVAGLAVAATLAFAAAPSGAGLALSAAAIAWLPWLHPRFLPVAGALALVVLVAPAHRAKERRHRALAVGLPLILATILLLLHFKTLFGSASLSAAYGPGFARDVTVANMPGGTLALLVDRQFGLLLFAPLLLVGAFAAWPLRGISLSLFTGATLPPLLFLAVGGAFSMWWGGASPPARFLMGSVPALGFLCAIAWRNAERQPALRGLLAALSGFGVGLLALACLAPRALHNRADGESGLLRLLAPTLDLDRFFAGFVSGPPAFIAATGWLGAIAIVARRPRAGALALALAGAISAATGTHGAWLDPFRASLRLLEAWDDRRAAFGGPDTRDAFSLRVPLGDPAWTLEGGGTRESPRFSLPAGRWSLHARVRSLSSPDALNLGTLEIVGDDAETPLGVARVRADADTATGAFALDRGERRVRVRARGVQGRFEVIEATLTPDPGQH